MNSYELKWGNATPFAFNDKIDGKVEFIIKGICKYKTSAENNDVLEEQIRTQILSISSIVVNNIKIDSFNELLVELQKELQKELNNKNFGSFTIENIVVTGIDYTDETKKIIKENSQKELEKRKQEKKKIIDTNNGAKDGQVKCPKCGATEIITNIKTGNLICTYCRCEFQAEKVEGLEEDISKLEGDTITSASVDIDDNASNVITLKCSSCGAEVVIDTANSNQARCHWCRNTLSINSQIPNGAVPDVVLAFKISKEDAQKSINEFVGKRKFYANPKFKKEFTTNNIMGVYFPYMLVDVNSHANFSGEGEILTRQYTRKVGDHEQTYYDADCYNVEREFDLTISGLSVESSKERLDVTSKDKTNNIINAIMPFDIENCVKYDANYLKGFTSEKRDTNVGDLSDIINTQAKDIARFAANDFLKQYNRGVSWKSEDFQVKGRQIKSAYLPVWLYSYQQVSGNKKLLHYVAVNARTKETMGSVPIHMPKLIIISVLIEILSFGAMIKVDWDYDYIFLTFGAIYFFIIYSRYRNQGARHTYEKDTKREATNLRKVDTFKESRKGLSSSSISGRNDNKIEGSSVQKNILNTLKDSNNVIDIAKNLKK